MYNEHRIDINNFSNLSDSEKLDFLVLLSSLAPSAHNTQPWLFKIEANAISINPNFDRKLPYSDKANRQLFISLGTAIENLIIASEAYQLPVHFNLDSNSGVFKAVYENLDPQSINHEALQSLVDRHTNRLPFESKVISQEILRGFQEEAEQDINVHFIEDENQQKLLRQVVEDSIEDAFKDKKFTNELSHWIKPSNEKYRDGMPGYTILVPKLFSYLLPFLIRHTDLRKMQKKMHNDWLINAPVYGIITSREDNISDWEKCGMTFEKIAVAAERIGLRLGVIGAPIETGDHYKGIQQVIGTHDRPLMFFRMGYGKRMPHNSPRLDLSEIIQT